MTKVSSLKNYYQFLSQLLNLESHCCWRCRWWSTINISCKQITWSLENCCRKSTWFGDRRKAMLEDIAILTGGTVYLKKEDILLRIHNRDVRYC
jgi:hypothetical protein